MIEALKFLIVGPLISIYRVLVEIERNQETIIASNKRIEKRQMATYEELAGQLTSLGGLVDSVKTELGSDIARLQQAIADSAQVPAAVVDAANALASKVEALASLDVPNPEPESPPATEPTPDPEPPVETPADPAPETPAAEGDSPDTFA